MAFQPAPNIVGVEVRYLVGTEPIENTLAFSNGLAPTVSSMANLISFLQGHWLNEHVPLAPAKLNYREIFAADLGFSDGATATLGFPPGTVGARNETVYPNETTFAINFKASGRGRTNKGRNFWPLLPKSVGDDNELTLAYANSILAFYELLRVTVLAATGFRMGFVSRRLNLALRPAGVFKETLECGYADLTLDSQRGRKPN